jgi:hypothetical protein
MTASCFQRRPHARRTTMGCIAPAFFALLLAGCEFEVQNPTAITEPDLASDPAMTGLMVGAVRSFDEAFNRAAMFSGLIADELTASGSWPAWHQTDKEGIIDPDAYEGDHANIPWRMWRELQRARGDAESAFEWMERVLPNARSDRRAAMVRLYAGMSYTMFGELFCQAAYDGGPIVARAQTFQLARERLNEAITIAQAAGSADSIVHMSRMLLARIALEENNLAGAAQLAAQIPTGFRFVAHYRQGQGNYAWSNMMSRGESTVEGPFRRTGDPRVPVDSTTRTGPDTQTRLWDQKKYPIEFMNWTIAKWQEARLIQAEHLLQQGDVTGAVALMNTNRAAAGLAALPAGLTATEARARLRTETMNELFLENRRLMYMRRWNEFPANWHSCMPIPGEERRTNPNL